ADEPAGAAFSDGDAAAGDAVGLDHLARLADQSFGQKIIAHLRQNPIRMLATAWAASPSPRPVKPRPSVVVAFTLTWSTLKPAISAIRARIAVRWGPIFGSSAMIVQSTWSMVPPCERTSSTAWARNKAEAAPFQRGSVGGK